MPYQLLDFYHSSDKFIKKALRDCFADEKWLSVFLNDAHHGLEHGNQVRLGCLKLTEKLTGAEKKELAEEGNKIDSKNSLKSAVAAVEIAAVFHDCGRLNDQGEIIEEEQMEHNLVGAKRAEHFCQQLSLSTASPYIKDAILSHDFQSSKFTPDLKAPETTIGKIVQASDQLGWFHPGSVQRTLKFGESLGRPFFSDKPSLQTRLKWRPSTHADDSLTTMLNQLHGPCGPKRFGVKAARKKAQTYKKELRASILQMAVEQGVKDKVSDILKEYENIIND